MSTFIKIRDLKNIVSLDYELPSSPGVYVITGLNGCGKTSLLVAIHRICYSNAYRDNFLQARAGIDDYANSKITYQVDNESVTYQHRNQRWAPSPRRKSVLLNNAGVSSSLFISTSGLRFFLPEKNKIPSGRLNAQNVSVNIIQALNSILGTTKFNNLKYIQVNRRLGRRPRPYRSDILYLIRNGGIIYSEYSFSLGERLLLNVLDYMENVPNRAILMIDEMELALHPLAQTRFYDHLKSVAEAKHLRIILTTHSASLIKHVHNVTFLESRDGIINVIKDCRPAYVLKDVSSEEEKNPDYIIFVEDEMAKNLLSAILKYSRVAARKHRVCKIVKVGGYPQVIEMTKQFCSFPPYNSRKVCAFLDKDVEDTIREIRRKGVAKTREESELIATVDALDAYGDIQYLNITPEIGVWKWIVEDCSRLMSYLVEQHGEQIFSMQTLVDEVVALPIEGGNERKKGKSKLKNLADRIKVRIPYSNVELAYDDMMNAYAKWCMNDPDISEEYTRKLENLLNR